ncbi:unnamed protein product, partial [Dicrocoelium dendriticum]
EFDSGAYHCTGRLSDGGYLRTSSRPHFLLGNGTGIVLGYRTSGNPNLWYTGGHTIYLHETIHLRCISWTTDHEMRYAVQLLVGQKTSVPVTRMTHTSHPEGLIVQSVDYTEVASLNTKLQQITCLTVSRKHKSHQRVVVTLPGVECKPPSEVTFEPSVLRALRQSEEVRCFAIQTCIGLHYRWQWLAGPIPQSTVSEGNLNTIISISGNRLPVSSLGSSGTYIFTCVVTCTCGVVTHTISANRQITVLPMLSSGREKLDDSVAHRHSQYQNPPNLNVLTTQHVNNQAVIKSTPKPNATIKSEMVAISRNFEKPVESKFLDCPSSSHLEEQKPKAHTLFLGSPNRNTVRHCDLCALRRTHQQLTAITLPDRRFRRFEQHDEPWYVWRYKWRLPGDSHQLSNTVKGMYRILLYLRQAKGRDHGWPPKMGHELTHDKEGNRPTMSEPLTEKCRQQAIYPQTIDKSEGNSHVSITDQPNENEYPPWNGRQSRRLCSVAGEQDRLGSHPTRTMCLRERHNNSRYFRSTSHGTGRLLPVSSKRGQWEGVEGSRRKQRRLVLSIGEAYPVDNIDWTGEEPLPTGQFVSLDTLVDNQLSMTDSRKNVKKPLSRHKTKYSRNITGRQERILAPTDRIRQQEQPELIRRTECLSLEHPFNLHTLPQLKEQLSLQNCVEIGDVSSSFSKPLLNDTQFGTRRCQFMERQSLEVYLHEKHWGKTPCWRNLVTRSESRLHHIPRNTLHRSEQDKSDANSEHTTPWGQKERSETLLSITQGKEDRQDLEDLQPLSELLIRPNFIQLPGTVTVLCPSEPPTITDKHCVEIQWYRLSTLSGVRTFLAAISLEQRNIRTRRMGELRVEVALSYPPHKRPHWYTLDLTHLQLHDYGYYTCVCRYHSKLPESGELQVVRSSVRPLCILAEQPRPEIRIARYTNDKLHELHVSINTTSGINAKQHPLIRHTLECFRLGDYVVVYCETAPYRVFCELEDEIANGSRLIETRTYASFYFKLNRMEWHKIDLAKASTHIPSLWNVRPKVFAAESSTWQMRVTEQQNYGFLVCNSLPRVRKPLLNQFRYFNWLAQQLEPTRVASSTRRSVVVRLCITAPENMMYIHPTPSIGKGRRLGIVNLEPKHTISCSAPHNSVRWMNMTIYPVVEDKLKVAEEHGLVALSEWIDRARASVHWLQNMRPNHITAFVPASGQSSGPHFVTCAVLGTNLSR